MKRTTALTLTAACGAAVGLALPALAQPEQPKVINIAGATLLENFFNVRGSTVDYIDADGDRLARAIPYPVSPAPGGSRRNDQVAPFNLPTTDLEGAWPAEVGTGRNVHWGVMYSNIGSTNGFQELINFGRTYTDLPGSNTDAAVSLRISVRSRLYFNRYRFWNNNSANDDNSAEFPPSVGIIVNTANPMNAPIMGTRDGNFRALYTVPNVKSTNAANGGSAAITSQGGLGIDIAPLDVPTTYATTQAGTPALTKNPLETGYGNNGRLAINKDGTITTTNAQGNTIGGTKLATLTGGANLSATLPGVYNPAADSNTIFDTSIAFAPVAPTVNYGVGIQRIDMSDLQHIFSSGRRKTGENLVVATRDSGSGTRNAFDNSMGRDPSWGVGDNLGPRNNATASERLGSAYLPSNKSSNVNIEPAVWNCRMGFGYTGPERGLESSGSTWLSSGRMETCAVRNDIAPFFGTEYSRPTISEMLQYDANGWIIGGPSVLASFGDPLSAPIEKGGLGWMEPFVDNGPTGGEAFTDTNLSGFYDFGEPFVDDGLDGLPGTFDTGEGNGVRDGNGLYELGEAFNDINGNLVRDAAETRPALLNPAMRNVNAAAYLNNISRSLTAFTGDPGSDSTIFTPGEALATSFVLIDAMPRIQSVADPLTLLPRTQNTFLRDYLLFPGNNTYSNNAFVAFGNSVAPFTGNSRAGKVPQRTAGTYSDSAPANGAGNPDAALTGNYRTFGGALLAGFADNLPLRNLTAGDFNGDGLRNAADIGQLAQAFRYRTSAGFAWTPTGAVGGSVLAGESARTGQAVNANDFSIEIVGDFNGDGTFNLADLRYFADGLALYNYTFSYDAGTGAFDYNGTLNRKQGFIDLDTAWSSAPISATLPLLPTTIATGKPYAAGDARGDIVGSTRNVSPTPLEAFRVARGAQPIGSDGIVDANDIDYVWLNYNQPGISGGVANWSDLNEAALFDLSADMDGDLDVDANDVIELVTVILATDFGDVNLNGSVNCEDRGIILGGALPRSGGWAAGDTNGDGIVNLSDLKNTFGPCATDLSLNCVVDADDIFAFLNFWFAGPPGGNCSGCLADWNNDGAITSDDIFAYLNDWFAANPGTPCP